MAPPLRSAENGIKIKMPPFPPTPPDLKPFDPSARLILYKKDEQEVDQRGFRTIGPVAKAKLTREEQQQLGWNEHWEMNEERRWIEGQTAVSKAQTRVEKLRVAADAFERAMKWPPHEIGTRKHWDEWKFFVGLVTTKQTFGKQVYPVDQADDEDDDDDDDDDDLCATFAPIESSHYVQKLVSSNETPVEDDDPLSKLQIFLRNPKSAVNEFLSSHMLHKGHIYGERHLRIAPLLMKYFITYLQKTSVLPDANSSRWIETLEAISHAQHELPNIMIVSRNMQKGFSEACEACFGSRSQKFQFDPIPRNENIDEEPQRKKRKTVTEEPGGDGEWGSSSANAGWGPGGSTWGEGESSESGGWGSSAADTWGESSTTPSIPLLEPVPVEALVKEYPSDLGSDYGTGIVEQGFRKVTAILPPLEAPASEDSVHKNFFCQHHRVQLEPWRGESTILNTSSGTTTLEDDGLGHNPRRDSIVVLTNSETIAALTVGMIIDGIWVELVPKVEIAEIGRLWYVQTVLITLPSYFIGPL